MSNSHGNVSEITVNSSTLGDPWVACDSTSHPGLKFYVNQRTGIKVWNITESEIEYAEKATIEGAEPQRHPTMNHPKDEKVYNKQIINNQSSNQLSNLLVNTVPISPFNVWDNLQNLPPQMQPQQSYTLVPTAIAEAYQRLLPLPNNVQCQYNANLQMPYNRKQNQPSRWTTRSSWRRYKKWNREQSHSHSNTDLREKLVRRKSCSESLNENKEDAIREITSKWKESNLKETFLNETSVQMSLAPLKLLTSSGSDSDRWYIVVDADVILKNFNYLNNMAAADPDCHLLVPYHVMSELQIYVSKSNNVQARRVLRFLTQQIESRQAMLGELVAGESACEMTMNTCVMLASQNNHVILISSNTEAFNFKMKAGNVHVFTMQDIKEIIENKLDRTKMFRQNSPTFSVKIVVPNNALEINEHRQDNIFGSTSPRMDSDLSQHARDISETSFQRMFDSTELAYNTQDISGATSRRMFDANECANENRDMSGITCQRMFNLVERANDNKDVSRRLIDATEHINYTEDNPGASSRKHIDATKLANTQDIIEKPGIMFDASEWADDTQDSSGTNSRKSDVSTKVAINAIGITSMISQRNSNSIECANDTKISGTNSRRSFVSTKLANAKGTTGTTSQRNNNINTIECANDTQESSGTNSQRSSVSTKVAINAKGTTGTTSQRNNNINTIECSNDTQESSGTNSQRSYVTSKVAVNAKSINGTTSQRDINTIECAKDTQESSGTNSRRSYVSTKVAVNAKGIKGTTSQRDINTIECANDIQQSSGTNSRRSYVSTKVAVNAKSIKDTTSQSDINTNKCANDILEGTRTKSRQSSVSTEVAIDAQEISGARRIFNATACASDARGISRINSQTTFDSTDLANDAQDTSETTSRVTFESSELNNDAQPKNHNDNLEQNLPNSPVQAKELAGTSVYIKSPLRVLSGELYNPGSYQSPSKSIPKSGNELFDTDKSTFLRGMLGSSKKVQSPTKRSDKSSTCSSSASGHVSLDTVGMRNIISMKRIASTTYDLRKKMRKQPAPSISSNKSENSITSRGVLPQAKYRPSVSRSVSYDSSEASGVRENVIVEETSTSGVISNTNSECSYAVKARNLNKPKIARKSVVMFEVACQSMEDILRARLDEWLFRFVQIMEEVLRVKLQEKLPREDKEYPAPRDLQEATTSIINKYIENFNIVNAANNLSYILYKTGDEKGKIADNIQPSDYMEMYSYGVFLVDTFLDMSAECIENGCKKEKTSRETEDNADSCSCYEVKTAAESLKKLMYDIQNVNQETFLDLPADISTDNINPDDSDQYDYDINTSEENMQVSELVKTSYWFSDPEEIQLEDNNTRSSYNLRPHSQGSERRPYNLRTPRRMNSAEDISTKHLQQANDVTFFNSLNLQRKDNGSDLKTYDEPNAEEIKAKINATDQVQKTDGRENEQNLHSTDGREREQNLHNIKIHLNKDVSKKSSFQSKVICNFTVNPDIERKLKAKQNEEEYADNCDNEEANGEESVVNGQSTQYESEICENNNQTNSETSNKSCFINLLAHNLRIFFDQIESLCNEYILISDEQFDTRTELHRELGDWCACVGYIHNAFDSVTKREQPISEDILLLLKNMAKVDFMPDDKVYLENSKDIVILKKTAERFHNRLQRILEMGQGLSQER